LIVGIFLTWDNSLNTWEKSGTLDRELNIFKKLHQEKGVQFVIFTYGDKNDCNYENKFEFLKIIPIYSKIKRSKSRLIRVIKSFIIPFKFKNELSTVEVIYQNQLLGCWVPILVKILRNKPLLIRTGYDMLDFAKKENKSFYIKVFYKILTTIGVRASDLFTVTSQTDLERFKYKYPKKKNKFILRPNWVEIFNPKKLEDRKSNHILTAGRLVTQKNFQYLITEFSNTKEVTVIDIVGEGDQKKELQILAEQKRVEVNFLGKLNHSELQKLFQNYKYYISTSLFEGNPKTLLEAMASGCVVFASNINNHKEIISHLNTGVLFELKENKLKNIFDEYKDDKEKLSKISKNAVELVKKTNGLSSLVENVFSDLTEINSSKY
jgi:glycosyltransferase involved in cell wall biosynthesis